ncbi:MAG: S-layer homology domain-containing protein, partial [Eggerthellaceae bacterium]|nr:S-layer homology domain-containing protein [Eggerthellaceae bacterium]
AMIARYCVNTAGVASAGGDVSSFPDGASISSWACEGVAFCSANGLVSGYSDSGNFDPAGDAERCQMAKIIAVTAYLFA